MLTATRLHSMTRRELLDVLCAGHPIDPAELDDTEYKGTALGLPAFVERLTWKTFKKVFHRDPETGALRGWNVRLVQGDPDGPCVPMTKGGAPFTFGHYAVVPATGYQMPAPADRGLVIDYGLGHNGPFDPLSRARDPIAAVNPGKSDLLIGWTYFDLGFTRVSTPSFFTLERSCALTHRASPPRASGR